MNNSQFRNLIQNDPSNKTSTGSNDAGAGSPSTFRTPMLGSRARASVPMTPRSVAGQNHSRDFARQVVDRQREQDEGPPAKRFKAIAAPKGTKLARGYQDRTQLRRGEDEADIQDDKQKRVTVLEEMLKLQQIDQATFEQLREQIGVGGDLGSTHLIKGLDWKLLRKIKGGEDIDGQPEAKKEEKKEEHDEVDVDDELDNALEKDITVVASRREPDTTEGQTTEEPQAAEVLTRDEILRRLKESRNVASVSQSIPEVSLGERFKKVSSSKTTGKQRFTEVIDGRKREVLITRDKNGNTKRKTRWLDPEPTEPIRKPAKQEPLGMDVPAEFVAKQKAMQEQEAADDEDDDIFQGVGADYDPLRDIGSDSDVAKEDTEVTVDDQQKKDATTDLSTNPRNYFSSKDTDEGTSAEQPITGDVTIMAAIKRAAQLRKAEAEGTNSSEVEENLDPDQVLKRKKFLERLKQQERADADDLDMGFGESRFGDDGDDDEPIWAGDGDVDQNHGQKKRNDRKRGGKKRKGDKDSVADVMSVLEGRKKG